MPLPPLPKVECITRLVFHAHWKNETPRTMSLLTGFIMRTNARLAKSFGLPPNYRKQWSKKMDQMVIDNYQILDNVELAQLLNEKIFPKPAKVVTNRNIAIHLKKIGYKRSKEQVATIKRKNQISHWEKGVYDHLDFPFVHPIGTFTLRKDGFGGKHLWFKSEAGWVAYIRYIYELHFGKIPPGRALVLLDGNPENVVIENIGVIIKTDKAHQSQIELSDNWIAGLIKRNHRDDLIDIRAILKTDEGKLTIELKRLEQELNRALKGHKPQRPNSNWQEWQVEYLKENYGVEPTHIILKEIGKNYEAMKYMAKKLGLETKRVVIWGKKAREFLENNFHKHYNEELAAMLNRKFPESKHKFTTTQVNTQLSKMGLKRTKVEYNKIQKRVHKKRKH